jgi:hypothetical protein
MENKRIDQIFGPQNAPPHELKTPLKPVFISDCGTPPHKPEKIGQLGKN